MNRRVITQDISWFLDLNATVQLHLDPPYQRRSVWTLKNRKPFIDTIFREYPCPAIFLHKTINEKGKQIHHVVDGKQRLETVLRILQLSGGRADWIKLNLSYKKSICIYISQSVI